MLRRIALVAVLILGGVLSGFAQESAEPKPIELEVLKAAIGVWDAEIEVWPQGLDSPSINFNGVEDIEAYGEHWISSDFDSEFMGETIRVHSIVGYDLDKEKMVGTVIDHGPYAATMTGDYDAESKTVTWMTEAKHPNGTPMVQKTLVTQKDANERILVLMVPSGGNEDYTKFMQVRYVKRE